MSVSLAAFLYLISSICFIMALRGLSHPSTARQGNTFGMVGMAIAILTTLALPGVLSYEMIILGILIGGAAGAVIAKKIEMTALAPVGRRLSLSGRSGGLFRGRGSLLRPGGLWHRLKRLRSTVPAA